MMQSTEDSRISEPSLESIAQNVYPCGSDIMHAQVLDHNTAIYSQDLLKQQRDNLVLSIENTFPNEMSNDFMAEHVVVAKTKNDLMNHMIGTEFKSQRRYLDLGNTNNYQDRFEPNEAELGTPQNRLAYDDSHSNDYNSSDEWLNP